MKAGIDHIGVGCGAIIVNDKDEVLLVKRSQNSRTEPGQWSRPGGQVEFGEHGATATEREVEEETGIKVKVVRPLEFTEVIDGDNGGKHWVALGYLARHVSGEPVNREPDKHEDIRWFPLEGLPENLTSYTRNAINVFLKTRQ